MLPHSKITHLLNKDQLAALGEVAANSAELEYMLAFVLMWCLRLNGKQTRALVSDAMLSKRITLLESIGKETISGRELKKEFKAIIQRVKDLSGHRNTVIHGTWGPKGSHISFEDGLDMEFGTKTPDGVIAENPKNAKRYSAKEIRQLADELHQARIDLWDFGRKQWWRAWTDEIFLKHGFAALEGLTATAKTK
jgi:hypothetical protein